MATWAVLEGENVINHITADTKETAEEVTGKTCVQTFIVAPGWKYVDGKFIEPSLETPAVEETPAE